LAVDRWPWSLGQRPTANGERNMRWTPGGVSSDVEDRRGSSGFGFGGAPIGIGGAVVLLILSLLFHKNFFALFEGQQAQQPRAAGLRAGLRAGGRDRASREEDPRRRAARAPGDGERSVARAGAVGASRAAGRLLRRDLGTLHPAAQHPGERRRGGGAERRRL